MRTCYSKILMFGEHTVVNGGQALALPFDHFYGAWNFTNKDVDRDLVAYADYIDHHDTLYSIIDIDAFFADLDRGMRFESNIPIGYGLGSSGALVAATFLRYPKSNKDYNILEVKRILADLESYFHGQSSGMDPLVSYYNQPLLLEDGKYTILDDVNLKYEDYDLFLMNTGIARSTGPLVNRFQEYIAVPEQKAMIAENYLPHVHQAIRSLIDGEPEALFHAMEAISGYQYAYLDFLIDDGSKAIWKEVLASEYFKVKICGAGGGGYLLGITKDFQKLQTTYPNREIISLS